MDKKDSFDFSTLDFEQSEPVITDDEKEEGKWTTIAAVINMIVYNLAGLVGVILVIAIFLKGFVWFDDNLRPLASAIPTLLFYLLLPIGLLFAIFKRTRGIGGAGVLVSSSLLIFSLWIFSLEIAYVTAGRFWLIIGLVLGGIGVIPISVIGAMLSGEWLIAFVIILVGGIAWLLRWFSYFILMKAE